MNRNFFIAFFIILVVILGVYFYRQSFRQKAPSESEAVANTSPTPEREQKEVTAVYEGKLPCADCEGVDTVLTLYADETYTMSSTYLGKDVQPFVEEGKWTYVRGDASDPNATVIQLYDQTSGEKREENYLVQGETLVQLDENMKPIDSPFNTSLTKQTSQ